MTRWFVFAWLAAGCSCGGGGSDEGDAGADSDSDSDSDTESGTGTGTGTGTESDTGTGTDTGVGGCGDIPTFEDAIEPTVEIHVATDGDDGAGDGSAGSPYATIERAADDVEPGAAIRIHAGTYAGGTYLSGLAGTPDAPIWIGGAPGEERPVISGGAEAIHLTRVRYLVLHDLEVDGPSANGVNCDDGGDYADEDATRWVVFRGLSIHDVGDGGNQDCLKLSGVDDYWVLRSELGPCSGSAVDHVGCHRGVIAHSTFSESSEGVQCKGGSAGIAIQWNTFRAGVHRALNMGGSTDFEFFRPPLSDAEPNVEARDILVLANVIEGWDTPFAFVGCVDCVAAQNTVVDPEHWLVRILQETVTTGSYEFLPSSNGRIVDNVFWYARANLVGKDVNVGPNTAPDTFEWSHNLWYAHDDAGRSEPALPSAETDGVYGLDPAFADAAGGDYSVGAASPVVGSGVALPDGAPGDFAGACWADPPSIGAFEGNPPEG